MVQEICQLASIRQPGVSGPNAAFGVLPTCTPTPTSTSTDTPTNTPTTAPTDTAIATSEVSATATLGGATEVPATETPEIQLPNTGSGSGSTNPFAIMALLLLAACGVVWGINRRTRNA
jgi:LPXTG-motif cell wall-anchored protein